MKDEVVTVLVFSHAVHEQWSVPSDRFHCMEDVNLLMLDYLFNGYVCCTVNSDPGLAVPASQRLGFQRRTKSKKTYAEITQTGPKVDL